VENCFYKLSLIKKFTHEIHNFIPCGNVKKSATLRTSSTGQQRADFFGMSAQEIGKKARALFSAGACVCNQLITNAFFKQLALRHCGITRLNKALHSSDAAQSRALPDDKTPPFLSRYSVFIVTKNIPLTSMFGRRLVRSPAFPIVINSEIADNHLRKSGGSLAKM